MKTELISGTMFDYGRLDRANYTLSLAAEALRCGLCTDGDSSNLQAQLFCQLGKHIHLYTDGMSSSVENRYASALLGSILYNLDLALLRMTPDAAVSRLFGEPLDAILEDGMQLNREYMLKALSMLRRAERERIVTVCIFYNRLYNGSVRELIRKNDILFDAARVLTGVDYIMPTVNRSAKGICGMIHMLEELMSENRFVNSFDSSEREALLSLHERRLVSPTACTLNLGQLVFEQAILCAMAGKPSGSLMLSERDCALLAARYTKESAYEGAVGVVHTLADRAPERYLMKLLGKFRAPLTMMFEGGRASILRYTGGSGAVR